MLHENQLLVMHRYKFGQEYYTLIGGGIDPGETAEQALMREVQEESGVAIANPRLVYIEEAGDPFGTQYIYVCDYNGGTPVLHEQSDEARINALGQNLYTPLWLNVAELKNIPFRSETLKQELLQALQEGFPEKPKTVYPHEDIRFNNPITER